MTKTSRIIMFSFAAVLPARAYADAPAATGTQQHPSAPQALSTSLQTLTFDQTDTNTTGGTPGTAIAAGLYQVAGDLLVYNSNPVNGAAYGRVLVNGIDRGDFYSTLAPSGYSQVQFSALAPLSPGDRISVQAASVTATGTSVYGTGYTHLGITGYNSFNGAPAATGTQQHASATQALTSSLQTLTFDQTDTNTTGGTPGTAIAAGLYQVAGDLLVYNSNPVNGAAYGRVLVNGIDRGDFFSSLAPSGYTQLRFSALAPLSPGDQVTVQAASNASGVTVFGSPGAGYTRLGITAYNSFNGTPAAVGTQQHPSATQALTTSLQALAFDQTETNTTGGAPGTITAGGLYQVSGDLLVYNSTATAAAAYGRVLVNGVDRGDFFSSLGASGYTQVEFSALTSLNSGDQVTIQAASSVASGTSVYGYAGGTGYTQLEIVGYNNVPEPSFQGVTAACSLLALKRRRRRN